VDPRSVCMALSAPMSALLSGLIRVEGVKGTQLANLLPAWESSHE